MRLQQVTAPTQEPVSLNDARDQLRLLNPTSDDSRLLDPHLHGLIRAARQYVEEVTGLAMLEQTFDYWLDRWPRGNAIVLPRPPLRTITSVAYTDVDGTGYTLTEDDEFTVDADADSEPGRIVLEYDETWPTEQLHPNNPIAIRFTAGWDKDSDTTRVNGPVPGPLLHAIKILVAHWDQNRGLINLTRGRADAAAPVPMSVPALLAPYKVYHR